MLRVQTPPLPTATREQRLLNQAEAMESASSDLIAVAEIMNDQAKRIEGEQFVLYNLICINIALSGMTFLTALYVIFR